MKTSEIHIRDPFVLPYDGKYYMYGTIGESAVGPGVGFNAYISDDLENWSETIPAFRPTADFWADWDFWAPEVHEYNGAFYMFATFKKDGIGRGTQILKSEKPEGPFLPRSDGPVTPLDRNSLDGTLHIEDGQVFMIYCREWQDEEAGGNGQMCVIELTADLKTAIGEPRVLFAASDATWVLSVGSYPPLAHLVDEGLGFITDGPFMYRCKDGALIMLWSSFAEGGYAQGIARSDNGSIHGNWTHDTELLFAKDGGHGMVFRTFDGKLMVTMHSPNETPFERAVFFELVDADNKLKLK